MPPHRAGVLAAYRELLRLISRLPEGQRGVALAEARAGLRAHRAEQEEATRLDLRKRLATRIAFLRTTTPRVHGEERGSSAGTGVAHYVLRGGQLVEGRGVRDSRVADGTISMEEARTRHAALLRRQHFGREPPRYDPSSF